MNRHFSPAFAGNATNLRRSGNPAVERRTIADPRPRAKPVAPAVRNRRCARYRVNVTARALAGSVGAYAVVATLGAFLARALPMARAEAVMTAMLVALLLFPVVTIWAFLTRSPGRACCGVIALATAFGTLATMLPLPPA